MEKAWSDSSFDKTSYLGRVKVDGETYELFANNLSFLEMETDFDKEQKGRTLYFLKSSLKWVPMHVAELVGSQSDFDKSDTSLMSGNKDLLIKLDG